MEGVVSSSLENPEFPGNCELLIVHTAEAEEWATYLQQILKSSRKFINKSIVLYTVGPADHLHGYNFEHFHGIKCIVPLLTSAFLDLLCDSEVLGSFQKLLHPPHRVVALLCGVLEEDVSICTFEHWRSWRKLYSEDEPALYISTILEAISDSKREDADNEFEALAKTANESTPVTVVETSAQENKDNIISETLQSQTKSKVHPACLTVQPKRILCGDEVTLYIILTSKLGCQSKIEIEFSSNDTVILRIPGTQENEYTVSVSSPDMPAGKVSLTMYSDESSISLSPVTYYTRMGEISSFLENASAPMDFMCQAFNITSKATEALDTLLTDSLKCKTPASGFQLFGIRQIENHNMAAYQRNEELPTLLHFAAKYGLKKLTTVLLQCPGALQAYSVMNKNGDYPNTLAERSGFSDLRQFMDEFVGDMLKSHISDSMADEEDCDLYESMSNNILKYSLNPGCREDIYESMIDLNPDCIEDLYEHMEAVPEEALTSEEAMLRKFFTGREGKKNPSCTKKEEYEETEEERFDEIEEDPYDSCISNQIYDTVDDVPDVFNRPPAPIPRPVTVTEPEVPQTYISRVFSSKEESNPQNIYREAADVPERPVRGQAVAFASISPSTHDPYAGMKTPGQRQLIALQERVKVGDLSVDEAVQEFKTWQLDQERRSNSIRFQQAYLKKLRDSICRRHNVMEKMGKELYITSPLPNNGSWGTDTNLECSLYESSPRVVAAPPFVSHPVQRGTWQKGSTSSTSSSRLSTHSTLSYSSGPEQDFEEPLDQLPPPPRPPRLTEPSPNLPPPRIPPRLPGRVPENIPHERYIPSPVRALPQRPSHRDPSPPAVPRRAR